MDPIVTLTMNPTVDASVEVSRVEPDKKLRTGRPRRDPGGGGVNVSRALRSMGAEAPACFPAGGAVGDLLGALMADEGVSTRPISIEGATRENLTATEEGENGSQYRFVMPGPELSEEEWTGVLDHLSEIEPRPRWLVASGSLPPGVPDDFYGRVARWAREEDVLMVLDTSADPLCRALDEGVYLIKPNARELGHAVGREIDDEEAQEDAARELVGESRAGVVVVSLGAEGVLLVTEDGKERIRSPSVRPRSKVGAGDSTVAGLVFGLARGDSLSDAARRGVAAGAAAVKTPGTALCRGEDVERLYARLQRAVEGGQPSAGTGVAPEAEVVGEEAEVSGAEAERS